MVDDITVEQLERKTQALKELVKNNPDALRAVLELDRGLKVLDSSAKNSTTAIKGVNDASRELTNSNKDIVSSYNDVGDVLIKTQKFMESVKNATIEYPQVLSGMSIAIQGVSKDFESFSNRWGESAAGMKTYQERHRDLIDKIKRSSKEGAEGFIKKSVSEEGFSNYSKLAAAAGKSIKDFVADTLEASLMQKNLRDALFSTAAATGQLGNFQKEAGQNFEQLDKVTADHAMNLKKLREASGLSRTEAIEHYKALMQVPGALQMTASSAVTGAAETVDFSVALEKVSRSTGISVQELSKQTGDLRDKFNLLTDEGGGGDEALKFLASMSKASNQLGLDYGSLKQNIDTIAGSFRYFGNTSQDVVKGYYEIAKGLEQTGLSAKTSGELATNFVTKIGQLSTAQKAYMSQMTGGPGGLMGAFDIDLKLREGKFKEVFDQARETMKSNLGEIVSLKEASQSPEAASQYMRQMTMLQSGPLGQLASSPEAAQRLLDAFKEGMPQELGDNAEAAKEYFQTGKDLQKKDSDVLSDMLASQEDMQISAQITAYNTTQLLMGNRATGTSFFGKDATQLDSYLKMKDEFARISEKAASSSLMKESKGQEASAAFGRDMELFGARSKERIASIFTGTFDGAKEMIERIKSSTGKSVDDVLKESIQEKNNKLEELKKTKGASEDDILAAKIDLKKAQEMAASPDILKYLTNASMAQEVKEGEKPEPHKLATTVAHVAKKATEEEVKKAGKPAHVREPTVGVIPGKGPIVFCSGCHEKIESLMSAASATVSASTPEATQ